MIADVGSLPLEATAPVGLEEAESVDVAFDEAEAADDEFVLNSAKSWLADKPPYALMEITAHL